jgi:hypothetical protein
VLLLSPINDVLSDRSPSKTGNPDLLAGYLRKREKMADFTAF